MELEKSSSKGGDKMKLVILDSNALNPGDLSWDKFSESFDLKMYERTSYDKIIERAEGAEAIIVNKCEIDKNIIDSLPNLKYVGETATGFNNIDVKYANSKGIVVTNVPSYGTNAVAQFTFALILELCHKVGTYSDDVLAGGWVSSKDMSYWTTPLIELDSKTLGIIGYGAIGKRVEEIAKAFGMNIITYNGKDENELEKLLKESDFISLHAPLNENTKYMINKDTISKMKDGVFLINTARGQMIVEEDLVNALESGKIAGAALDVVEVEPMAKDCKLLNAKNIIITPHIAWAPKSARQRLMDTVYDNLVGYSKGDIKNAIKIS